MRNVVKFFCVYLISFGLAFAQSSTENKKEVSAPVPEVQKEPKEKEIKEAKEPKEEVKAAKVEDKKADKKNGESKEILKKTKPEAKPPEQPKIEIPLYDYRSVALLGHGGFFRVESAQILPQNPWGFYGSYNAKFMDQKGLIENGVTTRRLDHIVSGTYVPLPFTEFSLAISSYTNLDGNNAELIQQMGNLLFGSKAGYSFWKAIHFATTGNFEIRSRVGDLNIRSRVLSYKAKGELTLDLVERFKKPFRFHTNFAFRLDGTPESMTSINMNELFYTDTLFYDQLQYGAGFEWLFKNMVLGTEYTGEYPLNAGFPFIHTPQRISGGIKIFPHDSSSLAINIGGEIGIFKKKDVLPVPDITFLAGFSFIFSPSQTVTKTQFVHHYPKKKVTATLRGIVKNKADDNIIEDALIVLKGEKAGVLSDKEGRFEIKELPFKEKTIVISKEGFASKEFSVHILKEDKILTKEFLIEKQPPSKIPGCPKVECPQEAVPTSEENAPVEKPEEKKEEEPASIAITHDGNSIITSPPIYFATGKMDVLVSSLEVLDKIVEYLNEHKEIELIRIEGYTDNTGSNKRNLLVSKERSKKVWEYLIFQGIDKHRLKYIGYGSKKPITSNDTEVGRMKNRRVELRILKEKKQE